MQERVFDSHSLPFPCSIPIPVHNANYGHSHFHRITESNSCFITWNFGYLIILNLNDNSDHIQHAQTAHYTLTDSMTVLITQFTAPFEACSVDHTTTAQYIRLQEQAFDSQSLRFPCSNSPCRSRTMQCPFLFAWDSHAKIWETGIPIHNADLYYIFLKSLTPKLLSSMRVEIS